MLASPSPHSARPLHRPCCERHLPSKHLKVSALLSPGLRYNSCSWHMYGVKTSLSMGTAGVKASRNAAPVESTQASGGAHPGHCSEHHGPCSLAMYAGVQGGASTGGSSGGAGTS